MRLPAVQPTESADLSSAEPAVSIVVPVRNEEDNLAPLIAEIAKALDGRWAHEIVYVNDGSTDATGDKLTELKKTYPQLRQIRHAASGGQSAAVRSGVRAARGAVVATLDGDGQNNPAFLPQLIEAVEKGGGRIGLAAGQRVGRKDTGFQSPELVRRSWSREDDHSTMGLAVCHQTSIVSPALSSRANGSPAR